MSSDEGGVTIFLTGLPAAGKTTTALALKERLSTMSAREAVVIDGDIVRETMRPQLGFSRADRDLQIQRITSLALDVMRRGGVAICAAVAPYDGARRRARLSAERFGKFFLVHVATPLDVCEKRDPKGLYAKARAGAIQCFTGISDPYEAPADADVILDTTTTGSAEAARRIISELATRWDVRNGA